MALKATIHKAQLQLADLDRGLYADHTLTLARHPSETEERLMVRLLVFALQVNPDSGDGLLEFTKGLFDADEPELWQRDLTGSLIQWVDVGQPDERRMTRACGRADRVAVWSHIASTPVWWAGVQNKVARQDKLSVWQVPADQAQALGQLCKRTVSWQLTVQDGTVWVNADGQSLEVTPVRLK